MNSDVRVIALDEIEIRDRLRDIDLIEADRIGASIYDRGQITPIMVAPLPNGRYRLVAGGHRVEGARRYGILQLHAVVVDGSDDELRLREIDENLYRHELTPYDIAVFIAERREVWERLFGAVKPGRPKKGQDCPLKEQLRSTGFVRATADQFKLHPKAVKRALQRRAHIEPELWQALKGTPSVRNASFLDRLAKCDPDLQLQVLERAKSRDATFENALKDLRREAKTPEPTPNLKVVKRAWANADNPERLAIVAFINNETKKKREK